MDSAGASSSSSSSSSSSASSSSASLGLDETIRDRSASASSIGSNDSILLGLPVTLVNRSQPLRTSIDLSSMNLDSETINQNLDYLVKDSSLSSSNGDSNVDGSDTEGHQQQFHQQPVEVDCCEETIEANSKGSVSPDDEKVTAFSCSPGCSIESRKRSITSLNLSNNRLISLPNSLSTFTALTTLDISENGLETLEPMVYLPCLTVLIACNNKLTDSSLIKAKPSQYIPNIKVLSLSGNQLQTIPDTILDCGQLRSLYLGANCIEQIPTTIAKLTKLRYLYLGGNRLTSIPEQVGQLSRLEALSLCENSLVSLPSSIASLTKLRSLALHMNQLTTLPTEIIKLESLTELSLRNNPLVVRFINDFMYNPPSLLELAGRCIKLNHLNYPVGMIPASLRRYLSTAQHCVNPQCQGVYFDSRIEQIKFVDFCGSYRLPLLQYLCSPKCTKSSSHGNHFSDRMELNVPENKMKRVLLG